MDGVVTLLPEGYVSETEAFSERCAARTRSKHRLSLNLYSNALVDRKVLRTLTAVAGAFALIYGLNYLTALRQLDTVLAKRDTIMQTYRLPETSFEREGLLKALEQKQGRQVMLREKAESLFALAPVGETRLQRLTLTTRKASLSFDPADDKAIAAFKQRLPAILSIGAEKRDGKRWTVEGTYE